MITKEGIKAAMTGIILSYTEMKQETCIKLVDELYFLLESEENLSLPVNVQMETTSIQGKKGKMINGRPVSTTPEEIISLIKSLPESDKFMYNRNGNFYITNEWILASKSDHTRFEGESYEEAAEVLIESLYECINDNSYTGQRIRESGFPDLNLTHDYCEKLLIKYGYKSNITPEDVDAQILWFSGWYWIPNRLVDVFNEYRKSYTNEEMQETFSKYRTVAKLLQPKCFQSGKEDFSEKVTIHTETDAKDNTYVEITNNHSESLVVKYTPKNNLGKYIIIQVLPNHKYKDKFSSQYKEEDFKLISAFEVNK